VTGRRVNAIPASEQISGLLGSIYDAALDPRLWSAMLGRLAPVFQSHIGLMANDDLEVRENSQAWAHGFDPDRQAEYLQRRDTEDYFWHGIQKQSDCSVFVGTDLIGIEEMHQTALYHELGVSMEAEYLLGGYFERRPDRCTGITITVLRGKAQSNYSALEQKLFQILLPHFQRAWLMNTRLAIADHERNSAVVALEHSPWGILILDQTGHASFVNRKAETLLVAGDGLTLRYGRMKFHDYAAQLQFDGIIRQTTRTSRLETLELGNSMQVFRPSGQTYYQVVVCPLNIKSDVVLLSEQGACLVFIHDPTEPREISEQILQSTYGLTHAEARLCKALFETGSLSAARDRLAISLNTGKTHLKNIFAKLGVSSQAQLMQMLAAGILST